MRRPDHVLSRAGQIVRSLQSLRFLLALAGALHYITLGNVS